jgi:hypothetical protein
VVISGQYKGVVNFDSNSASFTYTTINNSSFILKLNHSGNAYWVKTLVGANSNDYSSSENLAIDASGNIYTTGDFSGTIDFDPSINTYTLSSGVFPKMYINKLSSNVNFIWAKELSCDKANIDINILGQINLAGTFRGSVDFDPSSNTYSMTSISNTFDIFISSLDTMGNFLWAVNFGGKKNEVAYSINVDNNYNIFTFGTFNDTCDFNPSVFTNTIASSGGQGCYLHKLTDCKALLPHLNNTIYSNQIICDNTQTILSVNYYSTTNWYNTQSGGSILATGSSYTTAALSLGTYTYYAEADACISSYFRTPVVVTVNACTVGISETELTTLFNIYPNPTNGSFFIETNYDCKLQIVDVMGNIVNQFKLKDGINRVNISDLSNSIYLLKFINGDLIISKKILKL